MYHGASLCRPSFKSLNGFFLSLQLPMLVPGLSYAFETYIECLNDKGISDTVKVRYKWSILINTTMGKITSYILNLNMNILQIICIDVLECYISRKYKVYIDIYSVRRYTAFVFVC